MRLLGQEPWGLGGVLVAGKLCTLCIAFLPIGYVDQQVGERDICRGNNGAEHQLYEYYGMNLDDPDGTREVVARHLKSLRASI